MNRSAFFDAVRRDPFGGSLSQPQVDGCNAILDSCARNRVTNKHHAAQILAHVYHETGGYMLPIKETVYRSHKNKNPSDATVIGRLNRAWAKGQLSWVKTPYWREGWFGRGPIQVTHRSNYAKMGKRLGVDLVKNRNLALDPAIGADIAVVGMSEGMFTGKKLSDYHFPSALDAPPNRHPRRIVNGKDGTDGKISDLHRAFLIAIEAAGGISVVPTEPPPGEAPGDTPDWGQGGPPQTPAERPESSGKGWAVGAIILIALIGAAVAAKIYGLF